MISKIELNRQVYVFEHPKGWYAIYFPLVGYALKGDKDLVELIADFTSSSTAHHYTEFQNKTLDFLKSIGVISDTQIEWETNENDNWYGNATSVTICPTECCNLGCVYCYADGGHTKSFLNFSVAKAAIDYITTNAHNTGQAITTLGFHGGGEPTLNWNLVRRTIDYYLDRSASLGIETNLSISTNAVLPMKRAEYISTVFNNISVSMDGRPHCQNAQRPFRGGGKSFGVVDRNLRLWKTNKINFAIRSTVTNSSVETIEENFCFMCDRYKPKAIQFEPVSFCGRAVLNRVEPPDINQFVAGLLNLYLKQSEFSTQIKYSGFNTNGKTRFCGVSKGNLFVTTDGLLTSCLEILKRDDPRANPFIFGEIIDGTPLFIKKNVEQLKKINALSYPDCQECFAQWICAGDCSAKRATNGNLFTNKNEYRCLINRMLLKNYIMLQLERQPDSSFLTQGYTSLNV